MTGQQLMRIHNTKSIANTNRLLRSMSEYLHSFQHGNKKVYYLNKKGRECVNSSKVVKKTNQIDHILMRNNLYIMYGFPSSWRNEARISIGDRQVVADAFFKYEGKACFVEVDHRQAMKENVKKIERYNELSSNSEEPFNLVWLTSLKSRESTLSKECIERGINHVVLTADDLSAMGVV
ncbi:replication-relaxation family protein [Geomicrobium sediminis]|uniref:Uncharacterized protein n=1 Tax=Geomicrobium sediminis TaxID=1347788 RepID=A0ABS2PG57_9BACL|nr:replication-relaxation family protein [Geomicrobium sediminis]MBM7633808.1 hypothetical protein [Geomicrobium sediminis]